MRRTRRPVDNVRMHAQCGAARAIGQSIHMDAMRRRVHLPERRLARRSEMSPDRSR